MSTIRHAKCDVLVQSDLVRCLQCSRYRKTLHTYLLRQESPAQSKSDRTAPDSHVNNRYLSTPEKHDRLQHLHQLLTCTKLQVKRVKQKLASAIKEGSIEVDELTHRDLQEIVD